MDGNSDSASSSSSENSSKGEEGENSLPKSQRPKVRAKSKPASTSKAPAKQPPKRGRKKRPKDMPRRPLSAYNLYFRHERENIIKSKSPDNIIAAAEALRSPEERAIKRINLFQALAVLISKQWKALGPDDRKVFESMAKEEMKEYREKLSVYQIKIAQKAITGINAVDEEGDHVEDVADTEGVKVPSKRRKRKVFMTKVLSAVQRPISNAIGLSHWALLPS
ncbi:hypothetical protein ACA910_002914 [Epithemia clementina (nom. ined.)]